VKIAWKFNRILNESQGNHLQSSFCFNNQSTSSCEGESKIDFPSSNRYIKNETEKRRQSIERRMDFDGRNAEHDGNDEADPEDAGKDGTGAAGA
jgi:hypothetical protein